MAVLGALTQLKETGVNIVATLHQPRKEIFRAIQCVILLVPGGRLGYFDNPMDMFAHFSDMGFVCQPKKNMADFMMDLVAGFIPRNGHEKVSASDICDNLVYKWSTERYVPYLRYLRNEEESILEWNSRNENKDLEYLDNFHSKSSLERHRKPSIRRQLYLFLYGFNKTLVVSWLRQEKVRCQFITKIVSYGC
jgi:ABC-type multidrug transport system ATPase subunit